MFLGPKRNVKSVRGRLSSKNIHLNNFQLDLAQPEVVNRSLLADEILGYAMGPLFNCTSCFDANSVSFSIKPG